jgi:transcription-repair coupling factor (superfamily II helicase)
MSPSAEQLENKPALTPVEPVLPDPGRELDWTGLGGDSMPLAIAAAASRHPGQLLLIVPDMQAADLLRDQLEFFLANSGISISTFPDWETLPYDNFSPHQDIISERLATLYQLAEGREGVLIISMSTLMQRLAPRSFLYQNSLVMQVGERLDLDTMRTRLDNAGYRCVAQVIEHGEFAVRGSLLDLYPMGSPLPFRIDLFDEEIESIRTFDPETQRSDENRDAIKLLPAREFPLDSEAIRHFRQRFRAQFEGDPQACPVYREISQGITPGGLEYSTCRRTPASCYWTGQRPPAASSRRRPPSVTSRAAMTVSDPCCLPIGCSWMRPGCRNVLPGMHWFVSGHSGGLNAPVKKSTTRSTRLLM